MTENVIILCGILSFMTHVAGGCILIVGSRRFATWMFPENDDGSTETRLLGIRALAFSVVGVFILASALPNLIVSVLDLSLQPPHSLAEFLHGFGTRIIGSSVKLLIGLGLFLGCHGLAKFWSTLRYAGLRQKMGLCAKCGYDLTGNTSGVCPECGHSTSPSQTTSPE